MHNALFTPVTLGGLTLKNRIIFAPTSLGLRGDAYFGKLNAIAAGGCAMLIIGDVPVGKDAPLSLYTAEGFSHYRQICDLIHAQGSLVCAQLHQSDSDMAALQRHIPDLRAGRITADDLRRLLNDAVGPYITSLSAARVAAITESFGEAAILAKQAGFDMVQVHGDRMCGSFSSAIYNTRTDCYGGSAQNRACFVTEAVAAVRRALPDMPIDYKLAVRQENPHYGNAGVLVDELPVFVSALEQAGVTSFQVTLANHGRLTDTIPPASHPDFGMEGCFLPFCDRVRTLTSLPICGVGGLTDPDFIEAQLSAGRIDCAAMSRQLIADAAWPNKVQRGQADTVRRCIRCNRDCLGGMQRHEGVHCIFDPKET